MLTAYSSYWKNYFNFTGRSTRSEYWWLVLANIIISFLLGLITLAFPISGRLLIMGIWGLVNIIPELSIMIRRMRDANIHWAFIFLGLIPAAGSIILIIFTLLPSKNGDYNLDAVSTYEESALSSKSYKNQQRISLTLRYILLIVLAVIWIFPIIWIILASLTSNDVGFVSSIFPHNFTLASYTGLFQNKSGSFPYVNWLINTLIVAFVSAILSTLITIMMAFVLSRLRFSFRKPFLQIALVLGMFPGFMSMIALYFILKSIGMLNLGGLILVYVGGAGLAFYIAKGFFDTIPVSIDEAAVVDGATKWQVFTHITLPLSRPIIVYTALMAFIAPWTDFIFSGIILGNNQGNPSSFTIAYGLYNMVHSQKGAATLYFTQFIAGCVIIAIPITILFVVMQKFYVNGITAGADKG